MALRTSGNLHPLWGKFKIFSRFAKSSLRCRDALFRKNFKYKQSNKRSIIESSLKRNGKFCSGRGAIERISAAYGTIREHFERLSNEELDKNLYFRSAKSRFLGQSTVELALMMPILAFLLVMIFQGFRLNDQASQQQILEHETRLDRFDHGNGTIDLAGGILNADDGLDLISFDPVADVGDILMDIGTNLAVDIGLNQVFSQLDFFQKDTFVSGATNGAITESAHQLVNNGVDGFKFESVAWAAGTGGLASGESTKFFQGKKPDEASWREALGSAVQYGAIGFTGSEGDTKQIAMGAVQGLNTSDTLKATEGKGYEPLVGAAKGALQSTVSGALTGTLDGGKILIASGLGAYNTKTVAELVPLSNWKGEARQSAIFSASNAALNIWASGGDAATIAKASVLGAVGSHQGQIWKYQQIQKYRNKGQETLNGAGLGASASFVNGAVQTASTFSNFETSLGQAILSGGGSQSINQYFQSPQALTQATQATQNMFSSENIVNSVLQATAAVILMPNQNSRPTNTPSQNPESP